jgi:hypothetical protein
MSKLKALAQFLPYILFSLIVIGIGLAGYGGYNYYTSSKRISEIDEEREKIKDLIQGIDPNTTDVSSIALSDIPLRRERNQKIEVQHEARRMAGIGIALMAVGWLGWDFMKSRQRRKIGEPIPVENTPPPSG